MKSKTTTFFLFSFISLTIFSPSFIYAQQEHTTKKVDISFFKKLVLFFDSNQKKNKRFLKRYEKTGNILYLEQYIGTAEMQQRQHAENPFAYYIVKAIVAEKKEKDCKSEALWFYSAALQIESEDLRTEKDNDIMLLLIKLDKKYNKLGIKQAGGYFTWLRQKYQHLRLCHEGSLKPKEEIIDSLLFEIKEREDSILKEKENIIALEIAIEKLEKEKAEKELKHRRFNEEIKHLKSKQEYKRFRIEVEKIEALKKADFQQIKQTIDSQLAIPMKTASSQDAHAKFVFKQKDNDKGIVLTTKGQASGKHCTEDVQNATQQILDILLTEIRQHDRNIRQHLSVDLHITGHADWHGAGKKTKISYKATDNINETYTNRDGQERVFNILASETRNIQNEHLAFLRAYCAYQTAQEVLAKNQLSINKVALKAIEHFEPNEYDSIDGANFRGIELSVTINNLFQQYEKLIKDKVSASGKSIKAIKILEKQIANNERSIRNKNNLINKQEEEIEKIWAKIDKQEEQISDINFILDNANYDMFFNSEVTKIISSVKEDHSFWHSLTKKERRPL